VGKQLIAEFEQGNGPAFFVYGTNQKHKHVPEIVKYAGVKTPPVFVPSVANFAQGMAVQIPLFLDELNGTPSLDDLHAALSTHYKDQQFIKIRPFDGASDRLDPQCHNGTNMLEIVVCGDNETGRAVLIALLDNLGKGASGASVQNLNLMLGFAEQSGL